MIRKYLLISTCSLLGHGLFAQDDALFESIPPSAFDIFAVENETDTVNAPFDYLADLVLPEIFEMDVDSLLTSWHAHYFTGKDSDCVTGGYVPELPDTIYSDRLSRLPNIIYLPYNEQIKAYILAYVSKRSRLLQYVLGMANFYFPMIEQILDQYGLPLELKYLAVVESALNPTAVSRAGATGIWQFMLTTGKVYGLEINSLVDERRDPVKATHAACRYFKDMYQLYGDWNLVMASYNCGPGNVNKAIRRSGGKTDFWQIYPNLPRETRNYVPLFIAANYAMNYYCEHNICPMQADFPAYVDTVMVTEMAHLAQLSEILNIPIEQLRALNPQFRCDIVPGNQKPFAINLPLQATSQFIVLQDTIFKHRSEELFPGGKSTAALEIAASSVPSGNAITHLVKSGETLGHIANKYKVKVNDIMKWNDLRSTNLSIGKRLKIYSGKSQPVSAQNKQSANATITASTYEVKAGDSLYSIAKKTGATVEALKAHNNLSTINLKIGQLLKIPKS